MGLLLGTLSGSINLQGSRESWVRITALGGWSPGPWDADHTPGSHLYRLQELHLHGQVPPASSTCNPVILSDAGNFYLWAPEHSQEQAKS